MTLLAGATGVCRRAESAARAQRGAVQSSGASQDMGCGQVGVGVTADVSRRWCE